MPSETTAGIVYFWADGQRMDLAGDVKYDLPGDESEAMVGPDKSLHFKATPKEGNMEVEFHCTRAFMTSDYPRLVSNNGNLTVRAELANGVQLTMSNARLMNRLSGTALEGKATLSFCSMTLTTV